ncbi:MAG: ATP-binding cassette domain-containing protein, partial [Acidimicrobiales bacterium]|nr:ATP-binding cassette domain-containing protein [Acidimicrobiales bacterium]
DDLSFEVREGLVTGFLGPNGAGKTTTMRMILGLDRPTRGRVTVEGRCYEDLPAPLREVGALLDPRAFHQGRSAFNHLRCLAESNGIRVSRVDEVLAIVGLETAAKRRAGAFSLGMSQRLGIAAALLGDPKVLMFDEPVNGLDPEGIAWVRRLMRDLASEGRTVFVSSHLMSEMALIADHVIVIGRGRLIRDESITSFIDSSSKGTVRVVTPQTSELTAALRQAGATVEVDRGALEIVGLSAPEVGELAAQHAVILHELTPHRASLEEAFMELTQDSVEFHASGRVA